jgi:hypothetical protein
MRGETHAWFLEGKPKEKRTLGRLRRTWVYNIKMNPQEEGRSMDWITLVQDRER